MVDLEYIKNNPELVVRYMATKRFCNFARYIKPQLEVTNFHKAYYEVLDRFAKGQIKKLIVSCPPQHGKSEASSRLLPSFILGQNPDKKIVIGSYNAETAKSFNYDVQRLSIASNTRLSSPTPTSTPHEYAWIMSTSATPR